MAEPNGRKAKSRPQGVNECATRGVESSRRGLAASPENIADRCGEIIQSSAWDDDGVPPAVSFLGYTEEFPALVFTEFEVKTLPFDLNFLRFENAVHLKIHLSLRDLRKNWKQILFSWVPRKLFGGSRF